VELKNEISRFLKKELKTSLPHTLKNEVRFGVIGDILHRTSGE